MKPLRDERGVAAIELALGLPILVIMLWMFVQLGQVYRANAGIQQALGEGARYATLCIDPSYEGCDTPSTDDVQERIVDSVYGIGPGTFDVPEPTVGAEGTSDYYDLVVNYSQPTSLLLLPGPTVRISRTKRVWLAGAADND